MVKILCGSEKYLLDQKLAELKKEYSNDSILEFEEFSNDVMLELMTPSFFGKKLILVRANSLSDLNDSLIEYIKSPSETSTLIIVVRDMDKRKALYKNLENISKDLQADLLCEFKKISDTELKDFIYQLCTERKLNMSAAQYQMLAGRISYKNEATTLYDVVLYIDKISASVTDGLITEKHIEEAVEDNDEGNIFAIIDCLIRKDLAAAMREVRMVEKKECLKVLGLLLSKFRIAFKAALFDNKSTAASSIGVKEWQIPDFRVEQTVLAECIGIIVNAMEDIKSGNIGDDTMLVYTVECIYSKLYN